MEATCGIYTLEMLIEFSNLGIEPLSVCMHPKTMLTSRYMKFLESLCSSQKPSVRFLVNAVKDDNRTLTGKTLSRISIDTNLARTSLSAKSVRNHMQYFPVPPNQEWRCNVIKELIGMRDGSLESNLDDDEVTSCLNFLCTT